MLTYRCRCGDWTSIGSMPPPLCARCMKCGSGIQLAGIIASDLAPHDYEAKFDPDTGAQFEKCRTCWRSRAEIELEEP